MIIHGDALTVLQSMDSESVHCCVTSPPYYGLRDYGLPKTMWPAVDYSPLPGLEEIHIPEWEGCLGLEPTIEMFIGHIVLIFREVRRVLRSDGTIWVNFGDSYSGSGKGAAAYPENAKKYKQGTSKGMLGATTTTGMNATGCKPKDMMGIPWRVAFALQADGWYLRQDIIWNKPNPMPEPVLDRCTKSHEYIFLLSKSRSYYFDAEAIKEPCVQDEMANGFRGGAYCNNETFNNSEGGKRKTTGNYHVPSGWDTDKGSHGAFHKDGRRKSGNKERKYGEDRDRPGSHLGASVPWEGNTRNKRDVWTVATQPFPEAHFATFPPELIRPCILAGCPVGGITIDPFHGSGTTGQVSLEENRDFIGIDLNPDYIEIQKRRISNVQVKMII